MAELIAPGEKVRDLQGVSRRIPIEVEGNVTHDLLLTIWAMLTGKESNSAMELGSGWRDKIAERTPDDLQEELLQLGGPHASVWLSISAFLTTAPHPHDIDRLIAWLRGVDTNRLRRWVLSYMSHSKDPALVEQVLDGDRSALDELFGEYKDVKPDLIPFAEWLITTDELPERYADCMSRYRHEVFGIHEEDFGGAIARAAAARRAAPARGDAKTIVEEVTAGIDFDIPIGVTRIVLVPSVVTRPLSLIDGHRDRLIVYYGVADEFIDDDPEAPPSWLIRTFKALSDDKRLRIMRRVAEGETSLDDLTEMLDLSKSTVHHHVGQLRAAGLVRVRIATEVDRGKNVYSLRREALHDALQFLDTYLEVTRQGERDVG